MEISHWYAREPKTGISANMRLFLFIILIDSRRVDYVCKGSISYGDHGVRGLQYMS